MEVEERYLAMEWSDPHWVFTLILTALLIVGRIGFHKLNERHDNPVATIQVARTSLIDAYLWVKIPGESDGQCTRGLGAAGTTFDPEWGLIDPAAGAWFPEMALDLAQNANPPLP